MTTDNGGNAFPTLDDNLDGAGLRLREHGMTLRDHFAGLALAAMASGDGARVVADRDGRYDGTNWSEIVALNAYEFADAMIAEKRKRDGA